MSKLRTIENVRRVLQDRGDVQILKEDDQDLDFSFRPDGEYVAHYCKFDISPTNGLYDLDSLKEFQNELFPGLESPPRREFKIWENNVRYGYDHDGELVYSDALVDDFFENQYGKRNIDLEMIQFGHHSYDEIIGVIEKKYEFETEFPGFFVDVIKSITSKTNLIERTQVAIYPSQEIYFDMKNHNILLGEGYSIPLAHLEAYREKKKLNPEILIREQNEN